MEKYDGIVIKDEPLDNNETTDSTISESVEAKNVEFYRMEIKVEVENDQSNQNVNFPKDTCENITGKYNFKLAILNTSVYKHNCLSLNTYIINIIRVTFYFNQ